MKKNACYALLVFVVCTALRPAPPKTLFLLGDSISMQYSSPYLENMLAGKYTILRKQETGEGFQNLDIPKGSNLGNSRMALAYIRLKFAENTFRPDLMTLNCGLHDIKRDTATGAPAVDAAEYRTNLAQIFAIVKKRKVPLVWIRTTEVVDSIHRKNKGFHRYAQDLEQYNAIADEEVRKAGIASIDLYSFTKGLGANRFADHVHYKEEVKALQAAYIAGFLQRHEARP
ncbi:SGNH/GDSL hydrolase family protein [Paraflavitalea pollutisoli]|uniref:SGNH/GDSL hydrolase family protein n=1 Tax=Paraflavitalea pollutisoli TaxID=3034143 RepID=UPI0023EC33B0|nr:SGNH/GDSL hydrolase family protein [Paraflavitalea sp. H1-2-19X]